jgi:multicomponent Na+:H+ antiporter subunit G
VIQPLLDIASWGLILAGSFFIVVGAFGMLRMPELFTRMHAASVVDTLGAGLLIIGLMLQTGFDLTTFKLLAIAALFFFTGPAVTHALAQAALHEKVEPRLTEDRRGQAAPANPSGRRP